MKKLNALAFISIVMFSYVLSAQDYSPIDQIMFNNKAQTGTSALTLVSRTNGFLYQHQQRYLLQEITPDDRIFLASATKLLSAATILALVDDGLIDLDRRIGDYLPNFTGLKAEITVRQLLSHTSGFPGASDYINNTNITLAQSVDLIGENVNLVYTPGTAFGYGGVSFQVAGRIAEVVANKSWDEIFNEKIVIPLELQSTDYGNNVNRRIAGGAYSSAVDYGKFIIALLNHGDYYGTRILSYSAVLALFTDNRGSLPTANYSGANPYGQYPAKVNFGYGLGCWIENTNPATGRATFVSDQGATGVSPWINLPAGYGGAFFTKKTFAASMSTYDEIKNAANAIIPFQHARLEKNEHNQQVATGSLEIAPNPTTEKYFTLQGIDVDNNLTIEIYNATGIVVKKIALPKAENNSNLLNINIEEFSNGVYSIRISQGSDIFTKRLVVNK